MSGHWFWNFSFALFGFLLYFFLSIEKSEPMNLLLESFFVFILFFIIMYVVRILWAYAQLNTNQNKQSATDDHSKLDSEQAIQSPIIDNQPDRKREEELLKLTKQMEEEDVDKVLTYIRSQFQKDRS